LDICNIEYIESKRIQAEAEASAKAEADRIALEQEEERKRLQAEAEAERLRLQAEKERLEKIAKEQAIKAARVAKEQNDKERELAAIAKQQKEEADRLEKIKKDQEAEAEQLEKTIQQQATNTQQIVVEYEEKHLPVMAIAEGIPTDTTIAILTTKIVNNEAVKAAEKQRILEFICTALAADYERNESPDPQSAIRFFYNNHCACDLSKLLYLFVSNCGVEEFSKIKELINNLNS